MTAKLENWIYNRDEGVIKNMLDELEICRDCGNTKPVSEKTLETARMLADWFVVSGGFSKKYCTPPSRIKQLEEWGAFDREKQKTCKWFGSKRCPVNYRSDCGDCDLYIDFTKEIEDL